MLASGPTVGVSVYPRDVLYTTTASAPSTAIGDSNDARSPRFSLQYAMLSCHIPLVHGNSIHSGAKGDNVGAICELGSPTTLGVPVTVPLESMTPASAVGFPSFSIRKGRRQSHQIRTGNALTED
jgi:hypothetical protein